jgi:hypothetical protein
LGTTDVREAKRLALALAAEVDDLFVAAGKTTSELSVTAPAADGWPLSSVGAGAGRSTPPPLRSALIGLPDRRLPSAADAEDVESSPVTIAPALIDAAVTAHCGHRSSAGDAMKPSPGG